MIYVKITYLFKKEFYEKDIHDYYFLVGPLLLNGC